VFGFWINDPAVGGLGNNTYVTVEQFLDSYYLPLNVGDETYNGKYLAITDPYESVDQNQLDTIQLRIGRTTASFSQDDLRTVHSAQTSGASAVLKQHAYNVLIQAALKQTGKVFDVSGFSCRGEPVFDDNRWIVRLGNADTILSVLLDSNGNLLQFSSSSAE